MKKMFICIAVTFFVAVYLILILTVRVPVRSMHNDLDAKLEQMELNKASASDAKENRLELAKEETEAENVESATRATINTKDENLTERFVGVKEGVKEGVEAELTDRDIREMQKAANDRVYRHLSVGQDLRYLEVTELGKSNNKFYVVVHDEEASYYGVVVITPEEYGRIKLGQYIRIKRTLKRDISGNKPHFKYESFYEETDVAVTEISDEKITKDEEATLIVIEKFQYFDNATVSHSLIKLWDEETDTVISVEVSSKDTNLYQIDNKIEANRSLYGITDWGKKAYIYRLK